MKKSILALLILMTTTAYCAQCQVPGWDVDINRIQYYALNQEYYWYSLVAYTRDSTGQWNQGFYDDVSDRVSFPGAGLPYWTEWKTLQSDITFWDGSLREFNGSDCSGIYCYCDIPKCLEDEARRIRILSQLGLLDVLLNIVYSEGIVNQDDFLLCMDLVSPEIPLANNENQAEGADPISLSNAAYTYTSTDVVLASRGFPIEITRNYNSKCEYNSRYGNGWDMSYNMKVRPLFTADDSATTEIDESLYIWKVMLLDGAGRRYEFSRDTISTNNLYHASDRTQFVVLDKQDSQLVPVTHPYALIDKSVACYYFNNEGNLVRIEDRNQNALTLTYDTSLSDVYGYSRFFEDDGTTQYDDMRGVILRDYKLLEISDSLGNTLDFDYYDINDADGDVGLLKTITDPRGGRIWRYKYDLQYNNLVTFEKPAVADPYIPGTYIPKVSYCYNNPSFPQALTAIIDSEQQGAAPTPYLENTYDHTPETLRSQVTSQVYGPVGVDHNSTYSVIYDNDNNRAVVGSREKVFHNAPNVVEKSVTVTVYNDNGQTVSGTVASSPNDDNTPVRAFTTYYEYNNYNEVSKIILPKRNCLEYIYQSDPTNSFNIDQLTIIQRQECDVLPFNGTSDYATISDGNRYAFGGATEDFSIAFWVKRLEKDKLEYLFDRRDANGYGWHMYFTANNALEFQMLDDTPADTVTVTSNSIINDSLWHYIVVSINREATAGSACIYVDGSMAQPATPVSITNPAYTSTASTLYVGSANTGTAHFKGSLDEVMILNRAIYRDKANEYSIFGLSQYTQGLIGYWKMDETTGTTLNDSDPKVSPETGVNGVTNRNIAEMLGDGKVIGEIKTINSYVQHNGLDYLKTTTDSRGNVTTYIYDFDGYPSTYNTNVGNVMKIVYPNVDNCKRENGNEDTIIDNTDPADVSFTYNDQGQIVTMAALDDLLIEYTYYTDPQIDGSNYGRIKQTVFDSGGTNIITEYEYDDFGHVNKTIVDSGAGKLNIQTDYLYDAIDRLTQITHPLNGGGGDETYISHYDYTKNGKLYKTRQSFMDGPNLRTQEVISGYDLLDNLESIQDALGNSGENKYDDNENLIQLQDLQSKYVEGQSQTPYYRNFEYDERNLVSKTVDAEGNDAIYEYDANANLIAVTAIADPSDPSKNQTTSYVYNSFDRLIQTNYPNSTYELYSYDNIGNIVKKQTRKGDIFYWDYDAQSRLIREILDGSISQSVLVDDSATVISGTWTAPNTSLGKYSSNCKTTENAGATCQFECVLPAAGTYTIYLWWPETEATKMADNSATVNLNDALSSSLTVSQQIHSGRWNELGTYTFNGTNATVDIVAQGGSKVTYADAVRLVPAGFSVTEYIHDVAGRILRIDKDGDLTNYYYDSHGQVKKAKDQEDRDVQYQYDNLGRRTRLTYPDNTFIEYAYDAMSRITDIKDQNGNVIAHYTYDELSRRKELFYDYNADATYDYKALYDYEDSASVDNVGSRLEAVRHDLDNNSTNDLSYDYSYDKAGNCLTKTINGSAGISFGYDNNYQLLTADYPAGWWFTDETYGYDPLGNMDASMGYSVNNMNQYTSYGVTLYDYDNNGNLYTINQDGQGPVECTYTYDPQNRLISAVNSSYTSITYAYDSAGRRIQKNVNGAITKYAYDGSQVIAEYDGSDTLLRKFIYGPGIDEPIGMIVPAGQPNAGTYFYHLDAQGSVIALSKLDTTVKVVEKYTYSAFGRGVIHSPGGNGIWGDGDDDNTLTVSAYGNPYQYTSRCYDGETGLYYYRARMYDPLLGRFLQTDPIGYYDSLNLYTYCGNNPVNWNDPYGLCKSTWLDKFQVGLDIAGMLDPFGIADGLNATIYLFRGQYTDALMSLAGVVGCDVAKLGRFAGGATAAAGLYFIAKYGDEVAVAAKYSDEGAESAQKLYHYTNINPDIIAKKGLKPGSSGNVFATPNGNLSPLQAQIDLALPPNRGLPSHLVEIDVTTLKQMGVQIPQAQMVGRSYNMPGGGLEIVFPHAIPAEAIKVVR